MSIIISGGDSSEGIILKDDNLIAYDGGNNPGYQDGVSARIFLFSPELWKIFAFSA